jgi:hypothetical protein
MRLNKVQEVEVVRRSMTEWVTPFTIALREEQNKCYKKDLSPNRKVYAKDILKLNP